MIIRGAFRYMATEEIRQIIAPGVISEIQNRRGDPHPVFKAFIVGHEGEAQGYMIGVGNIVKTWFRSAIEMLFNKINIGIRLFHGHGETNDQTGRTPIGEVVGKKLKTIGDRLSTVIACYIYPSFRNLPLDVASIEADIDFEEKGGGIVVVNVNDVTGIALANKLTETPGFTGATLLGQLQAFAKTKHLEVKMTGLDDVKAFLKESGAKPSDVFGEAELTADPIVVGYAKAAGKEEVGKQWRLRAEAQEELAALKTKHADEIKTRDEKIRGLSLDATKGKVPPIFDKKAGERKLDEKQIKFIKGRLSKFVPPDKPEELESSLDKHLDSELDEYTKAAEIFGVKIETKDGKKATGAEPDGDTKGVGGSESDKLFDPANSPLI